MNNIDTLLKSILTHDNIGALADWISSKDDLYEVSLNSMADDVADRHENSIYHCMAHALLSDCSYEEEADAEEMRAELGMEANSYNEFATQLAYCIEYKKAIAELSDSRDTLRDMLEQAADDANDDELEAELLELAEVVGGWA